MKSYLSIDAGGTFLKSAVLDAQGEVYKESVYLTKSFSSGPKEQILQAFRNVIEDSLHFIAAKEMELGGVGIAFPGPFNIKKATPLMEHKFQSLYGIDLREYFYSSKWVPENVPIKFIHDANAVLAGELWRGNARGYNNAAVITLGTGLGIAISKNGTVLCNDIGGPYLSIFQLPYRDGILEDYVSKRGFLRVYGEQICSNNCNGVKVSDLGEWAARGEVHSLFTFQTVGEILGCTIRNILAEREIECLLFGGQISRSFPFMEQALKRTLGNNSTLKKIDVVKSIDYAAFWGAVKTILQDE